MKFIVAVIVLVLAVSVYTDDDFFPCRDDQDCRLDECCVPDFAGRGPQGKVCRDVGDDHGDLCGGEYFCPRCERGLECVVIEANLADPELLGCSRPANGTCQRERRVLDRVPLI